MPLKNELKILYITEGCRFKDFVGYLLPAFFTNLFLGYQLMDFCFLV